MEINKIEEELKLREEEEERVRQRREAWRKLSLREKVGEDFIRKQTECSKAVFDRNWMVPKEDLNEITEEFMNLLIDEKVKNIIDFCEERGIERRERKKNEKTNI